MTTSIIDKTVVSADHGEVSYNGIAFNQFRKHSLRGTYITDEAKRTITHVEYELTVGTTIQADDEAALATLSNSVKSALSEQGRRLVIANCGFGNMVIDPLNAGGADAVTHKDIAWGPIPQVISMEPTGLLTVEIIWTCKFCISHCTASPSSSQWMALNYTASYRHIQGVTERAIEGYVQIPQTRSPGMGQGRSADDVLDTLTIAVPAGYERLAFMPSISADRNRVNFTAVDRQLEGPAPYPYIADMKGIEYRVSNIDAKNFQKWQGTLSGPITVNVGIPQSVAAQAFYSLLLAKVREMRDANQGAMVFIDRLSFASRPFSRTANFSASFIVAGGCLNSVLGAGGMWTPVPGSNYQQWAATMPWGNRGSTGIRFGGAKEAIVDLCTVTTTRNISDTLSYNDYAGIVSPEVDPDGGWLAYENSLEWERGQSYTRHSLSEPYTPDTSETGDYSEGVTMPSVNATAPRIQFHGGPSDRVVMIGKAFRVGSRPPIPRLTSIGNVNAREVKAVAHQKQVACVLGQTVYGASWRITYEIDGYPTTLQNAPKQGPVCC